MDWRFNPDNGCKQYMEDNFIYSIGEVDGRMKLLIENMTTRKSKIFNLMNKDQFFVEREAETVIKREKENMTMP